jgi:hypothetical protein
MANECKMEFYFKRADIEKLLAEHPKAKGIIISHEIVQEKPRGSLKVMNLVRIQARVDPAPKTKAVATRTVKKSSAKLLGDPGDPPPPPPPPGAADGCPYPPGCTLG